MRTLRFLLQKEFRQIFRNKALLPLLFVAPLMQLLILPLAADYEVKQIQITIVDHDHSTLSHRLTQELAASRYFQLNDEPVQSYKEAFRSLSSGSSDLILELPQGFERNLIREKKQQVFIAVNAINGVKANLGAAYLNRIIARFNKSILMKWQNPANTPAPGGIDVTTSNWFNPGMNYHYYMVPGILVLLVTMIGAYLCALNIVKEKETGTIEQINVTPVKKYQFILGKIIPFWVIGMIDFSIGLFGVGMLVYGIVPLGSLLLLYGYLAIYLTAVLGLGLLISTYSATQQQAMSVAFFFMMLFVLMSGLFTPVDSMPPWAAFIARLSPVTYFMDVVRMLVLKGSGFADIRVHFLIMIGFAALFNGWAIFNYKKTG